MKFSSLRSRLIAWYVTTGAVIVLCCAVFVAAVTVSAMDYQARQAMASAKQQIPLLAQSYRGPGSPGALDAYLAERLAPLPVLTHTEAGFGPPHPGPMHGPGHANLIARLMMMDGVHPTIVSYGGAHTIVFIAPSFYERFLKDYLAVMLAIALIVLGASWRIAVVVASNSLAPLLRTTAALDRFGEGDFTPATVTTNDSSEVGELARAYNRAVRQITQALDDRAQASAEMRQFVADAGHQLRTPLTVIIGYLSAIAARSPRESDSPSVAAMLDQSRRMKTLINDLITLARLEHVTPLDEAPFDVAQMVRELPQAFSQDCAERLRIECDPEPLIAVTGADEFREALVALTDNAIRYGGPGIVTIRARRSGATCTVDVADGGPGFSENDLSRAFDRFYRGSASDGVAGTGLGLSIAAKSVARAGGTIELRNAPGGGGACVITIPLSPTTRAAEAAA
jgi:signal transduction histidine kinase